jgi:hypothetical protein
MENANAETLIVNDGRVAQLRQEALQMPSLYLDEKAGAISNCS